MTYNKRDFSGITLNGNVPYSTEHYYKCLDRRSPMLESNEAARLIEARQYAEKYPERTYRLSELGSHDIDGFPIVLTREDDGELRVSFTSNTHALIIGATRSGKTTGFVLPFLNIMSRKRNKPSIVVSDPKQELYRATAATLEANGYRVIVYDFMDYHHSSCWNPLTKIFRKYREYDTVEDRVEAVEIDGEYFHRLDGVLFTSQAALDETIAETKDSILAEVDNMVDSIVGKLISVNNTRDPYWEISAQKIMKGLLFAMLEDSSEKITEDHRITEYNFNFNTALRILESFTDSNSNCIEDGGYFTDRDKNTSKAYQLAVPSYIRLHANTTRSCITATFHAKTEAIRNSNVLHITSANTVEIEELDSEQPTAIFISYKDEDSVSYDMISMFISDLYTGLIDLARRRNGSLRRPFYLLLDEFGNFPRFSSFENVISACGSRNIWLLPVVQSYAQLNRIYTEDVAKIICDNLNMHIFYGSNNNETKKCFSEECGRHEIICPTSVLSGSEAVLDHMSTQIVPLVPVSALSYIEDGDCYVTQMRGDVIHSHIERSYTCPEFRPEKDAPLPSESGVRFSDPKYRFVRSESSGSSSSDWDD